MSGFNLQEKLTLLRLCAKNGCSPIIPANLMVYIHQIRTRSSLKTSPKRIEMFPFLWGTVSLADTTVTSAGVSQLPSA